MTEEDKRLLIQELSARLPYGVFVHTWYNKPLDIRYTGIDLFTNTIRLDLPEDDDAWVYINNAKPYLRSLSTMTEEEKEEYKRRQTNYEFGYFDTYASIEYLYAHNLDPRGLVERDLANEAPEGMYKI